VLPRAAGKLQAVLAPLPELRAFLQELRGSVVVAPVALVCLCRMSITLVPTGCYTANPRARGYDWIR